MVMRMAAKEAAPRPMSSECQSVAATTNSAAIQRSAKLLYAVERQIPRTNDFDALMQFPFL